MALDPSPLRGNPVRERNDGSRPILRLLQGYTTRRLMPMCFLAYLLTFFQENKNHLLKNSSKAFMPMAKYTPV
jgi:hypothetical protein